jgi:LmbE family N-acetylglucosaminyl deacetylase
MLRQIPFAGLLAAVLLSATVSAQDPRPRSSSELLLAIKKLNTVGSVLYIAAHPDDENTRLLSYLATQRMVRTGYLSVTRGDGGQNLIGTEQGPMLGLIRTQELLAARRVDGAEQFFTRANDFGFSKNPEETFTIWGHEQVLSDVVWAVRRFRPDVIIARFPTTGEGGHGHHTASAILAEEAFAAAGDSARFPEQLKHVKVWKPTRLYWNNFIRDPKADVTGLLRQDIGMYNPLIGKSHGEIAAESRSMHKSQGFGSARNHGPVVEYFKHLKGEPANADVLEGIHTGWSRIRGAEGLTALFDQCYKAFDPEKPHEIIPLLAKAYKELDKIEDGHWKDQKQKEIRQLIADCAGLFFESTAADYLSAPGTRIKVTTSVINRSPAALQLVRVQLASLDTAVGKELANNVPFTFEKQLPLPDTLRLTNPYWLENPHGQGMYTVDNPLLIGQPEAMPQLTALYIFRAGDLELSYQKPLVYKWTDPVDGEKYRPFEVLPPVTANFNEKVYVFADNRPREIRILLKANKADASGNITLELPQGWASEPASAPFVFKVSGEEQAFLFTLTPPKGNNAEARVKARVTVDGRQYSSQINRIQYGHIPYQLHLFPAEARLLPLDIRRKGERIGYIAGAGDEVAACLQQLGYRVEFIDEAKLEQGNLSGYDAVVVGVRAYNTRERMRFYYKALMEYVKNGGTLVVQYNTSNFISTVKSDIGPLPFKISRDRVTVEEAPVTMEAHTVFSIPNRITEQDFKGWVQERGLYFASDWDPAYQTPLSMNDPGEKPSKGSLLIAKHGKGYFIYTGLAFFRQLPAGVPGAYRLFVNLISLSN